MGNTSSLLKIVTYTSVNEQQVHTELVRLLFHMPGEANVVTPVSSVVLGEVNQSFLSIFSDDIYLLLDVALEPAVCVCRMQEVDLSPFERSSWSCGCVASIRLHTPDIASQNHIVLQWAIAAVMFSPASRSCGNSRSNGAEPL